MGVLDLLFWFVFVVYFSAHIYCADDVRVCDRRLCCAQSSNSTQHTQQYAPDTVCVGIIS